MNELFIKLIELRTRLITYCKLSDSTRELGISSSLSNFLEDLKDNYTGFDLESANYNAALIINSCKPQELREKLLANLINNLLLIKESEVNQKTSILLSDMIIIEKLFKDTMISNDLIERIDAFRENCITLKSGLPDTFQEMARLINEFYDILKQHIELIGITVQQIEQAAAETGNGDFSFDLEVKMREVCGSVSQYKKALELLRIFMIISSAKNFFPNTY